MGSEKLDYFRKKGREYGNSVKKTVSPYTGKLLLLSMLTAFAIYFSDYIIPVTFTVLTASVSIVSKKLEINKLGVELATFSTVITAATFEPRSGALLGLLFITAQIFSGGKPGVYILWVIPGYTVAGYVIGSMSVTSIFLTGTLVAAGLQLAFTLITALLMREKVGKFIQYAVFNVAFNALIFKSLGPPVMSLLSTI